LLSPVTRRRSGRERLRLAPLQDPGEQKRRPEDRA
jgi:hypothetical protein